jgi:hypothetical protein
LLLSEERTIFYVGYFSGFGVWFWRLGELLQGHQVARSFGLVGQESSQNPGAREMDKMLLASWVVSRFWAGFGQSIKQSLGRAEKREIRGQEFSIRQRYFYVCILMNM